MVKLELDRESLGGLVQEIVSRVLEEQAKQKQLLNGKLAVDEPQAAELLGLNPWQLRDLRLSGKIKFCRIVGNRIRYTPEQLQSYLAERTQRGN
jgi:hypothetical protein